MADLDHLIFEDILRRVVREELARVLPRYHPAPDRRLAAFLVACHAYSLSSWWACGELIADARRDHRRDLLDIIDVITAGCADPARSLGKFCRLHAGIAIEGLRLVRAKRLWCVCADAND